MNEHFEVADVTVNAMVFAGLRQRDGTVLVAVKDVAESFARDAEQLVEAADAQGVPLVRASYKLKQMLDKEEDEGAVWMAPLEPLLLVVNPCKQEHPQQAPSAKRIKYHLFPKQGDANRLPLGTSSVWSATPLGSDAFPPPESEGASIATAHMGAAVCGPDAHPSAATFDRDNSMLRNGAINDTFNAMLTDLWPAGAASPDALTRHLLLQSAIRTASGVLETKFPQRVSSRSTKWNLVDLPPDWCKEMEADMSEEALLKAVFGAEFATQ